MLNRSSMGYASAAFAAVAALALAMPSKGYAQGAVNSAPRPAPDIPAAQPVPVTKDAPAPALAAEPQAETATPPAPAPTPPVVAEPAPAPLVLPPMDDVLDPVAQALSAMENLERQFEAAKGSDTDLSLQRVELEKLVGESGSAGDALKPRIEAAKVQLDKLGPAPKDKQPAESQQIAAERTRLTAIVTTLEGAFKSTELVKVRASQLTARIQSVRHGLFAKNLFQRSGSPLLPGIWRQIGSDYGNANRQLQAVFGTWRGIISARPAETALVFGLALAAYALVWGLLVRPLARLMPAGRSQPPSYARRAAAASLAAPAYALPGVVAACVLYFGADAADLIYSRVEALSQTLFEGTVVVIVVAALGRAILEPKRPEWRLMDLSDRASRSLLRSVLAIALVYALDQILKDAIRLLVLPLPFTVALSFVTSLAFAGLLLRVVATPFVPATRLSLPTGAEAEGHVQPVLTRMHPRWLKWPLLALAAAIVGSALTGYVALSRFGAGQVVITGSFVVLVILIHLAIRTTERAIASPKSMLGGWLSKGLGVEDGQRQLIARTLSILLHILLACVAVPALFLAWGFSSNDVLATSKSALLGFQIGQLRISVFRILLALALFLGLLFATRLAQRWLHSTVLRPDRMDPGIANSIHQGVGYGGFTLAAIAAISFGGVDITNLAILAGALSVGIGFGLQSIVNNFVSGLILLVERPIKVGDLIVLRGGGQGFVRSISVRSTEIETADKSSLIVPNSELITNVVTNWTHRNALARVAIKVNASYKSDPAHVLAVLTELTKSVPLAMQQPPPNVSLDNLGADALEFSISVVVSDVNKSGEVQTMLRTAVYHAFQKNGIEFPTPERDIYLRDLDGVKVLLARVIEERQRKAAEAASMAGTARETKEAGAG